MVFQDIGADCIPHTSRMNDCSLETAGPSGRLLEGGRIPEGGYEAAGFQQAAPRALKVRTYITMTGRGVATMRPATPESWTKRGYSKGVPGGCPHPAGYCSHAAHDITYCLGSYAPRWPVGTEGNMP